MFDWSENPDGYTQAGFESRSTELALYRKSRVGLDSLLHSSHPGVSTGAVRSKDS